MASGSPVGGSKGSIIGRGRGGRQEAREWQREQKGLGISPPLWKCWGRLAVGRSLFSQTPKVEGLLRFILRSGPLSEAGHRPSAWNGGHKATV